MKKFFLLTVVFFTVNVLHAQMKIAVMDFKAGSGVTQGEVDGISAIFGTYFINPEKFTLVERNQIDRVIAEQGFQQSSLTNQQMVKVGQILNLQKMVVGDVNIVSGQYNVDVRTVDVETGAVNATDGATWVKGSSYRELMKNLATRLMTKMYTSVSPASSNASGITLNTVVVLYGYLKVFPEDLGDFPSLPTNVIAAINSEAPYGYNNWRVPTIEEMALIKANKSKISGIGSGVYMTSDGQRSGTLRLVTTGKTAVETEKERMVAEAEQNRVAEERRARDEEQRRLAAEEEKKNREIAEAFEGLLNADPNYGFIFVSQCNLLVEKRNRELRLLSTFRNICPQGWHPANGNELASIKSMLPSNDYKPYAISMRSERFDTDHNMLTRNYLTEYDPFTGKESVCEGMSNVYNKVQNINVPETPCNPTRYVRCVRARPTAAEVQSAIEKRKIQQQQQEEQQRLAEQKRIEEERLMAERKRIEEEKERKLLAADLAAWTDAKEKNTRDSYNEYLNNNPHGKYIEPAKQALNSMPKDAEYYRALGDSYYNKGDLRKTGYDKDLYSALTYYQKAAELDPGNTEYNNLILRSYSSLGSYWRLREDYSTAINYYKKALELNPTDAYTYVWAGNAFFENRDAVNGELCYKKAIEIDPKNTSFVKFAYNMFRNDYVGLMNKLYKEGERKTVKGMQGKLKEIEAEQQRIEKTGALAK